MATLQGRQDSIQVQADIAPFGPFCCGIWWCFRLHFGEGKYDVGVMLKSVDAMFSEKHFERLDMLLSQMWAYFSTYILMWSCDPHFCLIWSPWWEVWECPLLHGHCAIMLPHDGHAQAAERVQHGQALRRRMGVFGNDRTPNPLEIISFG